MAEPSQSLQNHARIVPAYHYFIFGAFTINLVQSVMNLVGAPSIRTVAGVLTAAALIVLAFYARVFALKAQDRVIRLEMRLRLKELLPPALQPRVNEFSWWRCDSPLTPSCPTSPDRCLTATSRTRRPSRP